MLTNAKENLGNRLLKHYLHHAAIASTRIGRGIIDGHRGTQVDRVRDAAT